MAVIDLLSKRDNRLIVTELKTSRRGFGDLEIELGLQPTFYASTVVQTFGTEPEIEYAILCRTKTPKVHRHATTRSNQDLQRLGDLIEVVDAAVTSKMFYPIESPLNCSGCNYRQQCRNGGPAVSRYCRSTNCRSMEGVMHACGTEGQSRKNLQSSCSRSASLSLDGEINE